MPLTFTFKKKFLQSTVPRGKSCFINYKSVGFLIGNLIHLYDIFPGGRQCPNWVIYDAKQSGPLLSPPRQNNPFLLLVWTGNALYRVMETGCKWKMVFDSISVYTSFAGVNFVTFLGVLFYDRDQSLAVNNLISRVTHIHFYTLAKLKNCQKRDIYSVLTQLCNNPI